jgi:hypothetical protein
MTIGCELDLNLDGKAANENQTAPDWRLNQVRVLRTKLDICGWGDSNSQGLCHTHLKRARIPIPPHPLVNFFEVHLYVLCQLTTIE